MSTKNFDVLILIVFVVVSLLLISVSTLVLMRTENRIVLENSSNGQSDTVAKPELIEPKQNLDREITSVTATVTATPELTPTQESVGNK